MSRLSLAGASAGNCVSALNRRKKHGAPHELRIVATFVEALVGWRTGHGGSGRGSRAYRCFPSCAATYRRLDNFERSPNASPALSAPASPATTYSVALRKARNSGRARPGACLGLGRCCRISSSVRRSRMDFAFCDRVPNTRLTRSGISCLSHVRLAICTPLVVCAVV